MKRHVRYMMSVVLLAVASGIILSCETEGSIDPKYKNYFIKYYGDDGNQIAKDFVINPDGTIVMVGTSIEANGDTSRLYVVKADTEGNVIWSKKLGTGKESARDIDVFSAGPFKDHYMILSNCKRIDTDSTDVKVIIVNPSGEAVDSTVFNLYSSKYGYLMSAYGYSLTALSDGGFVITGNIDSASLELDGPDKKYVDIKDNLSVRYDGNLNLINPLWITSFGGEPYAMGIKIFENGGGFFYAGYTDVEHDDELYDKNVIFVRLTDTGFPINQGVLAGGPRGVSEFMSAITKSPNGTYFAVGTQVDVNDHKIYACIVNSTFTSVIRDGAVTNAPDQADGVSIAESLNPGVCWILGNETRTGGRNIWIGKVNENLETVMSFTFGGTNNDDVGSAIRELPNGDILVLGTMELVNQKKMALIKVRPNGQFE